jgi:hypothetical protein
MLLTVAAALLVTNKFVGNIHEAQRAEDGEEQVPESGDSPGVAG